MNFRRLAIQVPRSSFILNASALDKFKATVFTSRFLTTSIRQAGSPTVSISGELCAVSDIGLKSLNHVCATVFGPSHLPIRRQRLLNTCTAYSQWQFTPIRSIHSSGGNNNLEGQENKVLPPLMPYPPIVWPKFIHAIRNFFFIHFIIKPYFDKEFNIHDFLVGAKEAVSVISNNMSEGKLDELEGLVEASALSQIRASLSKFTVFQQQLLRVATEDIFFAFPYQIGIIIPDENPQVKSTPKPPQTRHVEITVCLHVLRGLAEKQRSGETGAAFNFQEFAQDERNKYNVMICNYRFFKDFTEGCPDPTWIVNMVSHFLPSELNQQ